jgi:uncharacterized membrane protein YkvA (DUF1232 family)
VSSREEQVIDELAAKAAPGDVDKVSRQFTDKLARLQAEGKLAGDVVDKLQAMWSMLQAPDDKVPWSAKAKIMAALTYFVSPVDVIPDIAGKAGYLDDAQVVRLVWRAVDQYR